MDKQKRVNWESGEKELLTEIVTPFIKVIENKNCDTNTNKSKLEAWSQIYKEYNSNSKTQRTLLQIKGEWKRMKIVAKKKCFVIKTKFKTNWRRSTTRINKQIRHDIAVFNANGLY